MDFSKRPALRTVSLAERHNIGKDYRIPDTRIARPAGENGWDFSYVDGLRPRLSLRQLVKDIQTFLRGDQER